MSADAHAIRLPKARKKKRKKKPLPPHVKVMVACYVWVAFWTCVNGVFMLDNIEKGDFFALWSGFFLCYGVWWLNRWWPVMKKIIEYLRDDDDDE